MKKIINNRKYDLSTFVPDVNVESEWRSRMWPDMDLFYISILRCEPPSIKNRVFKLNSSRKSEFFAKISNVFTE
jgi:hypothetical protein